MRPPDSPPAAPPPADSPAKAAVDAAGEPGLGTPRDVLRELRRRGFAAETVEAMPGDVSRRSYRRLALAGGERVVLALYPHDVRESCRRFLTSGELLAGAGVRVPAVLAHDCAAGWVLLEDLGERTLYELEGAAWGDLEGYFADAVANLPRIATLPPEVVGGLNPPLDAALLRRELAQTRELFLAPRGLEGGPELSTALARTLEEICDRLAGEAPVPCHRDFGARNLIPLGAPDEARVGVLDHQDLRLGPPAYDLASLLNDSLFPPEEIEQRLLALAGQDDREAYHRAAAQRTLKAVGSYAAFAHRGSDRHLKLIPPTLARALHHLGRLPEASALAPRLARAWRSEL